MNRWARGENPFTDAVWRESWRHLEVSDAEWAKLLAALGDEIKKWREAIGVRQWDPATLGSTIGSVVHLAYHLGAIRQMNPATAGPRETQ